MGNTVSVEVKKNTEKNGIELYFNDVPEPSVRDNLKNNGFRWNFKKNCWYAKENEYTRKIANSYMDYKPDEDNVNVGDYFVMSWGYDQTNVNWFQVVSMSGKASVRIRAVNPPILNERATGGMSAEYEYKLDRTELLEPTNTIFIKDNEKGDLKRLTSYNNKTYVKISSYHAELVKDDTYKADVSWYA